MAENPYAVPQSTVADHADAGSGEFLNRPRQVPAANGTRWIADAWNLFRESVLTWYLVLLVFIGIGFAVSLLPVVGRFAPGLIGPFVVALVAFLAADIRSGRGADIGRAFNALARPAPQLALLGGLALAANALIAVVAYVIFFGPGGVRIALGLALPTLDIRLALAFLVILALTIPVAMALYFAPILIALHDRDVPTALRTSVEACARNWVPFLLFGLAALGLGIVAVLPLGLGLLVAIPVMMLTGYTSYRDIFFED